MEPKRTRNRVGKNTKVRPHKYFMLHNLTQCNQSDFKPNKYYFLSCFSLLKSNLNCNLDENLESEIMLACYVFYLQCFVVFVTFHQECYPLMGRLSKATVISSLYRHSVLQGLFYFWFLSSEVYCAAFCPNLSGISGLKTGLQFPQ